MGKTLLGYPTGTSSPAQRPAGAPSTNHPEAQGRGVTVQAGGQAWVDEEPKCKATLKSNGWPCDQSPRPNSDYCFGHRNYEE